MTLCFLFYLNKYELFSSEFEQVYLLPKSPPVILHAQLLVVPSLKYPRNEIKVFNLSDIIRCTRRNS